MALGPMDRKAQPVDGMSPAELEVFWRLHEGLLCQSPGSRASTERAFGFVPRLPESAQILDLGSGPGRQTFDLAALTPARITAIDLLPRFIDGLNRGATERGIADRVVGRVGSMAEIDPHPGGYDLIWCEGAVYNMGFEEALRSWPRWLAPGGCIGLSEVTWLTPDRPRAARDFWQAEYPAMQSHAENLACIASLGYEVLGTFPLPPEDWSAYYDPLDARIEQMREGETDSQKLAALDEAAGEARLYRESRGAYGYVFYVLRPGRTSSRP